VSISDELARARQLTYAADETSARDLLLSLIPQIGQEDRDDLMLEVLAQLGEIYLARGANDGVQESIQRIDDCLAIYTEVAADANAPMICRYSRRAQFLRTGLAAAQGDHDGAAAALEKLNDATSDGDFADLADEHTYLRTLAQVLCATALCDDDLHARSLPLWGQVLNAVDQSRDGGEFTDHLLVTAATAYGRFCVETGRLSEAEPWLRRAGARAQQSGWELATARTQLERAAACWSVGDHVSTEQLVSQAYPVIERHARAHDLARCWLYLGFTRMASGALEAADECWEHAEQHWRDLGKPLHLHRILLQRSWISIFWSRFGDAVELIAQARELLDSSPRSSWLQYAQLDNHLGTVWRADALADLGFDSSGDPDETLEETEARQAEGLGILRGEVGTPEYWRGLTKLEQAAEL
jgi:tetratricopeptide (TPR) repeat protein